MSYKVKLFFVEAGTLMPGSEVVIADVSNNGQCGMGRLGEVWIRCDWSCSNYLCSYGGSPQLPLDDLQKSTKAKLMVGNDKGKFSEQKKSIRSRRIHTIYHFKIHF